MYTERPFTHHVVRLRATPDLPGCRYKQQETAWRQVMRTVLLNEEIGIWRDSYEIETKLALVAAARFLDLKTQEARKDPRRIGLVTHLAAQAAPEVGRIIEQLAVICEQEQADETPERLEGRLILEFGNERIGSDWDTRQMLISKYHAVAPYLVFSLLLPIYLYFWMRRRAAFKPRRKHARALYRWYLELLEVRWIHASGEELAQLRRLTSNSTEGLEEYLDAQLLHGSTIEEITTMRRTFEKLRQLHARQHAPEFDEQLARIDDACQLLQDDETVKLEF
ncbi:MAG: hypothetical protein KDB14_20495 [Planctomycetales bacterium]|nr:hypothetical protein [Planctomycetales bacterium]